MRRIGIYNNYRQNIKNKRSLNKISRRNFVKLSAAVVGGMLLPHIQCGKSKSAKKLFYIALDGLHPDYLSLDTNGNPGGSEGNWLMPNLRRFIDQCILYPDARGFLPAATDMNHLNALAGTSSAQTGCLGVSAQIVGWDSNGKIVGKFSDLNLFRDDMGRPVDTIFHAWKRKNPGSKTAFISGKPWVAEMFRSQNVVDVLVTGLSKPDYLPDPLEYSFADPATDEDAECDPEGTAQTGTFVSLMPALPKNFPNDEWVVNSAIEVLRRENPDLTYILLAEADDSGHAMGAGWNRDEFQQLSTPIDLPQGCTSKESYNLASRRNPGILREPILDAIREIDHNFGRLIEGMEDIGALDNAMVIILSDHTMINFLPSKVEDTDLFALLKDNGLVDRSYFHTQSGTEYALLYWRENKDNIKFAKDLLLEYKVTNPETGVSECPWWVLDKDDLIKGVEGLSLPGELYHKYFYENPEAESIMIMPDLQIYTKNGWQLPVYGGTINNLGLQLPENIPPMNPFVGGHGSSDTVQIFVAIYDSNFRKGAVLDRSITIADLGVTAAARFGLELKSTTVGRDLSEDWD